ncbi:hypothetical protein [Streptomyces sp. NPDC008150]|uniref:hypothetical protein n=1 Tax=Streptomyces sp. NPDC008150 TaxID=3364816 RepID=UPI0036EC69DD
MRRTPLTALLVLSLPLFAACGGGGGGGARTDAAGTATPPAASAAAPAPGSAAPSAAPSPQEPYSSSTKPAAGPKDTVPDDEITPATGSFTKKEKKYLSGRVPKGNDPAAILQAGQDTCDRLRSTAKIDRTATVGAIVTGDISGAAAAVDGLCPDLKSLVEDADGGYADGSYTHPAPGTYKALTPTKSCAWTLDGTSGRTHTITVKKGTKSFTSTGCYAWGRV